MRPKGVWKSRGTEMLKADLYENTRNSGFNAFIKKGAFIF